jgi:D-3-phosphoglycerate dehydrogenase
LDAILVWHLNIDEFVASKLKVGSIVVRYGVGYDNIDTKSLMARNIPFCNCPDYGTEEVADTTCAMLLNLQRNIARYDLECRNYKFGWQENTIKSARRISSLSVGIIGVGRIGTSVINRLKAFGYDIHGYDPYQPAGHEKAIGYTRHNSLESILSVSDNICICCDLTEETRGMVNEDFIEKMKRGANLVVTSRGGVISGLEVLESALKSEKISAISLDVLPEEPPNFNSPLLVAWKEQSAWIRGRLVINPHTSYYSQESFLEMRSKAAETARLFLLYGKTRNKIN